EGDMTVLRGMIKKGVPPEQVASHIAKLREQLQIAGSKLDSTLLSAGAAFTASLVILLREGLEAILVLAALAAFLIKTGRRDGLRYLYYGTGAALGLGLLTWYVSSEVVTIGGAGRELTEAFAALFAAAMLFYVGFWLHSKTSAMQWKAFIEDNVRKALDRGTLWGLALLAFVAVYREIFETVLFYQALWLQTGREGHGMVLAGLGVAAAGLVVLAWLILKFSTRLPLRRFFSATSIFLFVLAVIFAGKGIAALQEAGMLPVEHVRFPTVELLGIYPNLEGLGVQLAMVILAVWLYWKGSRGSGTGRGTPT
ncbi:MAG TPA: cytochrome C, partial [Gammaproteobacteria bacterium]|nr:cytochrome C [Gammaproteobacteria bacterium]